MKVGLIDVDSRHYPNLALMKLSAGHRTKGDDVEWWWGPGQYDRVYMSKVFDSTYTPDMPLSLNSIPEECERSVIIFWRKHGTESAG